MDYGSNPYYNNSEPSFEDVVGPYIVDETEAAPESTSYVGTDAPGEGVQGWVELRCVAAGGPTAQLVPDALRCLALHPTRELVYAGTASGVLHAHSVQDSARIASARPAPGGARDADPALCDAVVVALPGVEGGADNDRAGADAVVVACAAGVCALTRGCAPLARVGGDAVAGAAAVARNPASDAQVAVGGTSSLLAVVDWPGQRIVRQASLRGGNQVTCAEWVDVAGMGSLAMFATATGRVSVCDPSSMREVNAAAGFAGPVTSFAVRGPLIAACGMSMRGGMSYVEQAVKLFDLRSMHQPLASVPFPAGPVCVAFDEWVSSTITGGDALWVLSTDGMLQCLELSGVQSGQGVIPVSNEIHLDAENDVFTTLAVSSDGLVICGDTGGFLHQWSATEYARLNAESEPVWESELGPPSATPPVPNFRLHNLLQSDSGAPIPMSVLPFERGLLSDHFVDSLGSRVALDRSREQPGSTRPSTTRGYQRHAKSHVKIDSLGCARPPFSRFPPVVSAAVIESANWHDFVAYAQAPPDFVRNTMSSGHEPPPVVPHLARSGRDGSSSPKVGARFRPGSSPSGRYRSSPSPPRSGSQPPAGHRGPSDFNLAPPPVPGLADPNVDAALMTPAGRSSYVEMDLVAWESVEGFDFLRYNQSGMFCGLENALPNVYVNAAIQCLYFTPPFRNAIAHHSCEQDTCIACELGFLFTMLDVGGAGVAVEAGNFSKAFKKMANAGALGLLDGSTALPLAARIESFVSYLLEQLHKDCGGDDETMVSQLTGANVLSFGKFSPSGVEWERASRPFQHTLSYDEAPDNFPALVKASLYRRMDPTRAFCSASGAFETMSQTRKLASLPNLLVLCANSKAPGYASWWDGGAAKKDAAKSRLDVNQIAEAALGAESRLCAGLRLSIGESTQELSVSALDPLDGGGGGVGVDGVVGPGASGNHFATAYDAAVGASNGADIPEEAQTARNAAKDSGDLEAEYELAFVIARAAPTALDCKSGSEGYVRDGDGHLVAYVRVPGVYRSVKSGNDVADLKSMAEWWCFNDFVIAPCEAGWKEVASFSEGWKMPCLFGYVRRDITRRIRPLGRPVLPNIREVIGSQSCNAAVGIAEDEAPPGPGTQLGLDCEFVMVEREDCEITPDGRRTVVTPARMALARVSVVRGAGDKLGLPLIDDYVEVREPVVDYLTRFSGISAGDLEPGRSPYTVRPLKTIYKKLLALVDSGVTLVGHGLKKDLRVLNFAVPAWQVVDTVVLFRDPGKRLLSLRFLVGTLLGADIQTGGSEGHDSVEDALAAVRLYGAFEELQERDCFSETLRNLYTYGYQHGWKVNAEQPFSITG